METSFFLLQKSLYLITVCNRTLKVSETQNKTFYRFCWKITIVTFSKCSPGTVSSLWPLSPQFSWLYTPLLSIFFLCYKIWMAGFCGGGSEALNRKKKQEKQNQETTCSIISTKYYNWLGQRKNILFLSYSQSYSFQLLLIKALGLVIKTFLHKAGSHQKPFPHLKPLHQVVNKDNG